MPQRLEGRMDARQIVMEAGMSARPEYYSGRGATANDLNDKVLERVYQGVKEAHGEETAKQFAQMVADIPKLSATDFLLTLYRLENYGWKWDKKLLGDEKGVYIDGRTYEAKISVAFATFASALGNSSRDETDYIRGEFIRRHGIQDPRRVT